MRTKKPPVTHKPMSRAEVLAAMAKSGRSKYGNIKTVVRGEKFDSATEAMHWKGLLIRQRSGEIANLQHHVVFPVVVNKVNIGIYTADFVYTESGKQVIVDVKSLKTSRTQDWRFRVKVLRAIGIDVVEVIYDY